MTVNDFSFTSNFWNMWIIVLTVGNILACWWLVPESSHAHLIGVSLSAIVAAAVVGELLEFVAGALGASRLGGSKSGTALALGGSIGAAARRRRASGTARGTRRAEAPAPAACR